MSTEDRQRERRSLLIDAAFGLLADGGSSATTVRGVCGRARLNPRYFYESFVDLDSLVVAVYDQVVSSLHARVASDVVKVDDTSEAVRTAVSATVHFIDEDPRRGRVLYVEALGNEALNRRRIESGFDLVELVRRDTARRGSGTGSEQFDRVTAAMLVGGFSEIIAAWLDGRIAMTGTELIDSATAVLGAVIDSGVASGPVSASRT